MVCALSKLSAVNVSCAGETVPSAVFELDRSIVIAPAGAFGSETANVAVPPASLVRKPSSGVTTSSPPPGRRLSPHAVAKTINAHARPRATPQVVLIARQDTATRPRSCGTNPDTDP